MILFWNSSLQIFLMKKMVKSRFHDLGGNCSHIFLTIYLMHLTQNEFCTNLFFPPTPLVSLQGRWKVFKSGGIGLKVYCKRVRAYRSQIVTLSQLRTISINQTLRTSKVWIPEKIFLRSYDTVVCIKVRTASFPRFWKNHP